MDNAQSLTSKLYLEVLRRCLEGHPEKAAELAVEGFEGYLEQLHLNEDLLVENAKLRAQLQRQQQSPQLFPLAKMPTKSCI